MTAIAILKTINTVAATTTATVICVFLNFSADDHEVLTFFNLLIQLNNHHLTSKTANKNKIS